MVKCKADILASIKAIIGESTDDNSLSLVEDITDTFDDYENKTKDTTNWKEKYTTLDQEWRKKYRDRFFSGEEAPDENKEHDTPEPEKLNFDDLFKEEK